MASVNEEVRDANISHQIGLSRYSNGVVRRIIALLNRTDADLFRQLRDSLERLPPASFTVERLEQLLYSVAALNLQAYQAVGQELTEEMRRLVEYEAGYQYRLFESAIPASVTAQISVATVSIDQTYTAALARPFQGRLLREWASGIQADRMTRIRDTLRLGYVEGQTISQMVQRVRGTKARGYSDGIIESDRRNAESVVRTAVSHVAGVTRDTFYEENESLIQSVQWLATLDSRTSPICRLRDGKKYANGTYKPLGHSIPWLGGPGRAHWGCRSTSIPVLKSWRELGLDIDEIDAGTRASMDGQVAADTTYGQWLKRQSASRQDDILGASRGKLLRDGGVAPDKFYNDKGRYLSLDELRARDAEAFKRAGL